MIVQLARSVAELRPGDTHWRTEHPVLREILDEITDTLERDYHPCQGRFEALLVARLRKLPGLLILVRDRQEPHPGTELGVTP